VDVDINQGPTGFTPTTLTQSEGTVTGTTIATFSAGDPDTGDTHTFSLVSGTGDADNASFTLSSAGELKNAVVFDRETKSSYSIRVRVTDQGGLSFEDTRTVTVLDVNETPYGLTLSNNTQNENTATGTTIGTFTGLDVDAGETFTYALTGTGNDNSSFTLSSAGVLKNDIVFNYESKSSYTIEVTVTDSGNNTYTGTFTILVLDVNEAPSSIQLSNSSIDENTPTGSTIGTLSTTDPDANNTFTYTLVAGTGDADNGSFTIDGDVLKSNAVFDYETDNSLNIRVRSTDQGSLFVERALTISVTNISVSGTVSVTNPTCYGGNGTIEVTSTSGGSSPYTYSINGTTYQTSTSFTAGNGTYTVYIKDNNDEVGTVSATVTEPTQVVVSVDSFQLPSCNSTGTGSNTTNNGSITVSATGGTGTKTYSKDNGATYQVSGTFTGLVSGSYTIIAKDENDCTGSTSQNITLTDITTTLSKVNVDCNGSSSGSVTVAQPSGGTGVYQVKLGLGGTYETVTFPKTYSSQSAGTKHIYIKDSNECEYLFTTVITEPTALNISEASKTYPTCSGDSNGSITVSASGGTSPYEYSINLINWQSSTTFFSLSQGSYGVFVRDTNGCTDSVLVDISRTAPSITISVSSTTCGGISDGQITVSGASGGSGGPYSTKLNSGGTYQILTTSRTYGPLSPGDYNIYVKDSNECETSYTRTVGQAPAISVSTSGVNPTCSGDSNGSITVTASGGTGVYEYRINSGNYQSSNSFTGLSTGTYTLWVRDSNGCESSTTRTLSKSQVTASYTVVNSSCGDPDGSVTLNSISGGNGGAYQYQWNGGSWTTFSSAVTLGTLLFPGTYVLNVRDSLQCTTTYNVVVAEPTPITFTTSPSNPTCWDGSNGSITVNASGGNGSYQYSKNGGTTWQTSNVFGTLSNGTYTIRVKDSVPCYSATSSITLNKTAPSATLSTTSVNCFLGADGSITISNPTGGVGGAVQTYQHRLNEGTYVNFESTSYSYTSKEAGTYTIWIKDFAGCEKSYSVIISTPTQLTATISSYVDGPSGSVTVTSGGGTWNKTYRLYNDTTSPYTVGGGTLVATISNVTSANPSQTFSNLIEGYYYVIVTDANGCTASSTIQSTFEPSAFCHFVFVPNNIDINRYGLRYSDPNGTQTDVTFSSLFSTPITYGGDEGSAYGVCSMLAPSTWDSQTNTLVPLTGVADIGLGDSCTTNFNCIYQS
jgi:hypothetical protein